MRAKDLKTGMKVTVTRSFRRKHGWLFENYSKSGTIESIDYGAGFCMVFIYQESNIPHFSAIYSRCIRVRVPFRKLRRSE